MSCILSASTNSTCEYLLIEVIEKARLKGAKINSWYQSPNGRTVIDIAGKMPVFYLSIYAAVDSLIHQYNLISQYRYLYQSTTQRFKQQGAETIIDEDHKISVDSKAIYVCDTIFANMDNELTASTRRKLVDAIAKIYSDEHLSRFEFYQMHTMLIDHFRQQVIEVRSTKKKKQLQLFIHFIEEISLSDIG